MQGLSTKQVEITYLLIIAQENKHVGHSRAQTHNIDGLVLCFSTRPQALSICVYPNTLIFQLKF